MLNIIGEVRFIGQQKQVEYYTRENCVCVCRWSFI